MFGPLCSFENPDCQTVSSDEFVWHWLPAWLSTNLFDAAFAATTEAWFKVHKVCWLCSQRTVHRTTQGRPKDDPRTIKLFAFGSVLGVPLHPGNYLWWSANVTDSYTNAMDHVFSIRDELRTPLFTMLHTARIQMLTMVSLALAVTWVRWMDMNRHRWYVQYTRQPSDLCKEDKHWCRTCSHWPVRYEKCCAVQVQVSVCQETSPLLTSY